MGFFKPTWIKIGVTIVLSIIDYLLVLVNNPVANLLDLPGALVALGYNSPEGAPQYPKIASFISFIGHYDILMWLFLTIFSFPLYYLLSCIIVSLAQKLKKQKK